MARSAQDALRIVVEGTARETGEGFFRALVENLAEALGTHGAWVAEYLPDAGLLRGLAARVGGDWVELERPVEGTPCQGAIDGRRLLHIPDGVLELFPREQGLRRLGAVSYMGVPLTDLDGTVLGHLAVMDRKPMPPMPETVALFEIFAGRAAAELQRLRAERQVREREAQLGGLVDSAMDAIVRLDGELRVAAVNPAAERTFGLGPGAEGVPLTRLVPPEDAVRLQGLARDLVAGTIPGRRCWIAGGLTGMGPDGATFPAEASLSAFEVHGRPHFSLILRNVNERLEAERRIQRLTDETE
jgi:PAS domain S-box-containing protein